MSESDSFSKKIIWIDGKFRYWSKSGVKESNSLLSLWKKQQSRYQLFEVLNDFLRKIHLILSVVFKYSFFLHIVNKLPLWLKHKKWKVKTIKNHDHNDQYTNVEFY